MTAIPNFDSFTLEEKIARDLKAPGIGRRSRVLLYAILGFTVLFLLWAALTQLDTAVRAPARVVPSARLQLVSHLEGGIVRAISVRQGDVVAKGAPLVLLDATQSGAELGAAEAATGALAIKMARLTAEVQGREPVYPAPRSAQEAQYIAIERALHAARMANLSSIGAAGRARVAAARSAVAEASADTGGRSAAARAAEAKLAAMQPLVERGIEPAITLTELRGEVAVARANAAAAASGVHRSRASVGEAAALAAQAREEWRATAAAELTQVQAEYATRAAQIPALNDRVRRLAVPAPLAGRVNRVLVSTIGSAVAPGAPLVEIVPEDGATSFEVKVRPSDIAMVRIGQEAKINVSAYESAVYGAMTGRVTTIAPDAVTEERTGDTYYIVRVEAPANAFRDPAGKLLRVGPGMTAEVNLLGEKRSVLDYILTPITRLRDRAFRE